MGRKEKQEAKTLLEQYFAEWDAGFVTMETLHHICEQFPEWSVNALYVYYDLLKLTGDDVNRVFARIKQ